jgi:hypothetical protein
MIGIGLERAVVPGARSVDLPELTVREAEIRRDVGIAIGLERAQRRDAGVVLPAENKVARGGKRLDGRGRGGCGGPRGNRGRARRDKNRGRGGAAAGADGRAATAGADGREARAGSGFGVVAGAARGETTLAGLDGAGAGVARCGFAVRSARVAPG